MLCSRFASRSDSASSSSSLITSRSQSAASREPKPVATRAACPCAPIDDVDLRQPRLADALGQRQQRVLPARRIHPALETRRRASEHDDRALVARAHDRHLARVIARRFALLVARLVLFVDDDRAEVARAARRSPSARRRRFACAPARARAIRRTARRRSARCAARRSCRRTPRESGRRFAA